MDFRAFLEYFGILKMLYRFFRESLCYFQNKKKNTGRRGNIGCILSHSLIVSLIFVAKAASVV